MKKQIQITLGALALLLLPFSASAQEDISSIFKAGGAIGTLAEGYLKPAGVGFAAGLGSNWYNTAATHSVLGFDLTIGASVSFVPTSEQNFNITGIPNISPVNPSVTTAPTFGGSGSGVDLQLKSGSTVISTFKTPDGISKYMPSANIQLGIGLPLGTDITIRYSPDLKFKGMNVGLWGIGVKHNVKQWIPVVNMLPFDASVMVAYTNFGLDYAFDGQLKANDLVSNPPLMLNSATIDDSKSVNQGFKIHADALMANFILSKSFLFFTPYVGVGITRTNFSLDFTGSYPTLGAPISPDPRASIVYKTSADLPKVSYNEIMPGTTVGFRMKLFFITALHAQYTFQKYPTASLGFGINFR
jgi:hypothetical protein